MPRTGALKKALDLSEGRARTGLIAGCVTAYSTMKTTNRASKDQALVSLAETIGIVAGAIAIAAFGVAGLAASSGAERAQETDSMDPTKRLLSGGNRARTLAALKRFEQGQFVQHDVNEISAA